MPPSGLQRLLTAPPILLLISSLASADAITGRVVDANGVGVAGVDIDPISLGGGNPDEQNDGTDAAGYFTTTLDPGVYEVRFFAPANSGLLPGVVTPVVVAGTKNMGTITLSLGAIVSGTIRNEANQPVGNVRIDHFNAATGAKYVSKGNTTNAFGNFQLTVPKLTAVRYELLTNLILTQVLVPREIVATASGDMNVGNLILKTGVHVTGTARGESVTTIAYADLDVTDTATGQTVFTPSDNTNISGLFDVVLAPGTYDLELTRPSHMVVVSADLDAVVVGTSALNVGDMLMRDGVYLVGTVRDASGQTVQAVDVNVYEVATGRSLALSSDNTNALGAYLVVVPPTLLDVVFSPPWTHSVLEKDRHLGVNVPSTGLQLDGELPGRGPVSYWPSSGAPVPLPPVILPIGAGSAGSTGVPHIHGERDARGIVTLFFNGGRPGAQAALLLGRDEHALAALEGVHVVRPDQRLALRLDEKGEARFQLPAADATLSGLRIYAQLAVHDVEADFGFALSPVLALELP